MNRTQLEQRLLVLVTLGLVAFGLVMVFSATSASAALGEGDPMRFLVKQGLYALVGLTALALLSRFDYHRLRPLAPILLLGSFAACVAVLVVGPAINGAHRWFIVGPMNRASQLQQRAGRSGPVIAVVVTALPRLACRDLSAAEAERLASR